MNETVSKIYRSENDIFGIPQTYKGVDFYPILIKDLKYQDLFYKIFAHPKSYIANVDVLKASYLKFLVYVLYQQFGPTGQEVVVQLEDILRYITKQEKVEVLFKQNDGRSGLESVDLMVRINEVGFSELEFDDIREIVLEQNNLSIEYVESYNPELEAHLEFINRNMGELSFQDQVFTFCVIMKIGLDEVRKYSLFQFSNLMEKLLTLKEYDLYKPLLVSGQITLKSGDIKHYLYHSTKSGRYDAIFINKDAFMETNKGAFG